MSATCAGRPGAGDRARLIEANLFAHLDGIGRAAPGPVDLEASPRWMNTGCVALNWVYAPETPAAAGIDSVLDRFRAFGAPCLWVLAGPQAADVARELTARGCERLDRWSGMTYDLTRGVDTLLVDGLQIDEVRDERGLEVWASTWGEDLAGRHAGIQEAFLRVFRRVRGCRHFVARVGGVPAATGSLFRAAGAAGIYWIKTTPAFRGRGIASALTSRLLREARRHGDRLAVLQSTSRAARMYRRLGFEACCDFELYVWRP
jgi:ribosomal protein S18 acetylase RimI-like enzyme